MKKLLVTLMCVLMVISMIPAIAFAGAEGEEFINSYYKVSSEEFLEMADENGLINLDKDLYLTETVVINDGKEYTVNFDAHFIVACESTVDNAAFKVTNGTLNFINEMTIDDEPMSGVREESELGLDYVVVVDGEKATFKTKDVIYLYAEKASILMKKGNLEYNGEYSELDHGHTLYTIENEDEAYVVLTGGTYYNDIGKYVPNGYSVLVLTDGNDKLMYAPCAIPADDNEAIASNIWAKDDKGYYYRNQYVADLAGVKYESIAYAVEVVFIDENDECNYFTDWFYFPAKVGLTYSEAYKSYTGEDLKERTQTTGHFAGWKKVLDLNNYVEWGEMIFEEGKDPYYGAKILNYSDENVDINAKVTGTTTIVAKWCNDTKTTVVGKAEATYAADGYTGDTVCAGCGLVFEKGKAVPKLLKVEEQKVEVTEKVVEEVVKEATTSKAETVVIPLADAKEEIKVVEIPTKAVETVVESGKALTVETPTATVTLDNKALETVVDKAEGAKIELQVEAVNETELLPAQKEAVKEVKPELIISAEIVCATTGKEISKDFGGGKATVALPFQAEAGAKLEDYIVIYIADDGTIQKVPTKAVDGNLVFEIEHFSEYAVVKKEAVKDVPFVNSTPETGDTNSMLPWMILMAATATGITVLNRKED